MPDPGEHYRYRDGARVRCEARVDNMYPARPGVTGTVESAIPDRRGRFGGWQYVVRLDEGEDMHRERLTMFHDDLVLLG